MPDEPYQSSSDVRREDASAASDARHEEAGRQSDERREYATAASDRRREMGRFDWTHLVAYCLLAGAFIFTANENREQGRQIGAQQAATQQCVDNLRGDLRAVLMEQIELRKLGAEPSPDEITASLRAQIARLEAEPC